MKIIETTTNSKVETVKATRTALKMSEQPDGTELTTTFVHYSDSNSKGEEVELLSVKGSEGVWFGTNSKTFMEEYEKLLDLLCDCDEDFVIVKTSGTSKNNRQFISCECK